MYQGLMGGVDRASNRHNAPFQTPDCQQRALGHRNLAFYRQRERETETPNPLEFPSGNAIGPQTLHESGRQLLASANEVRATGRLNFEFCFIAVCFNMVKM